jgi:hypothetical protein
MANVLTHIHLFEAEYATLTPGQQLAAQLLHAEWLAMVQDDRFSLGA